MSDEKQDFERVTIFCTAQEQEWYSMRVLELDGRAKPFMCINLN